MQPLKKTQPFEASHVRNQPCHFNLAMQQAMLQQPMECHGQGSSWPTHQQRLQDPSCTWHAMAAELDRCMRI